MTADAAVAVRYNSIFLVTLSSALSRHSKPYDASTAVLFVYARSIRLSSGARRIQPKRY